MGLDARGYISIAELVVYVPIAVVASFLVFKQAGGRKTGWIYLTLLSIGKDTQINTKVLN